MTLRSFIDAVGRPDHAIAVLGDDDGLDLLTGMLAETFGDEAISVERDIDPEIVSAFHSEGATAVLLESGRPVATSPMDELYETILAVNSDLFITGARRLGEIELPDVLANLDDRCLRLRGYPLAHKEKLLLIIVSRYIEQLAWQGSGGTLRSSFQRLSRLGDEIGTKEVYTELASRPVDVHVYGVDDGASPDMDVTVHSGTSREYRDSWFVVYRPDDPDKQARALVCLETDHRIWDGFWTEDRDRIAAIDDYIATNL